MRRYWDANAFLGYLKGEEDKVDVCTSILESAERGECVILTSSVTFVEVVHYGRRLGVTQDVEEEIKDFFRREFIEVVSVDRLVAEAAREMLWRVPALKNKDALHFATAYQFEADVLETYDSDLLTLDGQAIGGREVRVAEPHIAQVALIR